MKKLLLKKHKYLLIFLILSLFSILYFLFFIVLNNIRYSEDSNIENELKSEISKISSNITLSIFHLSYDYWSIKEPQSIEIGLGFDFKDNITNEEYQKIVLTVTDYFQNYSDLHPNSKYNLCSNLIINLLMEKESGALSIKLSTKYPPLFEQENSTQLKNTKRLNSVEIYSNRLLKEDLKIFSNYESLYMDYTSFNNIYKETGDCSFLDNFKTLKYLYISGIRLNDFTKNDDRKIAEDCKQHIPSDCTMYIDHILNNQKFEIVKF